MTSVWADFKAEEKGDVKFALRPDLLKEEPEEGYVEPLMVLGLVWFCFYFEFFRARA
jgi:hypothetical protein